MPTYASYLQERIADKISEISDEKLLLTIYAIIMESVTQESQTERL